MKIIIPSVIVQPVTECARQTWSVNTEGRKMMSVVTYANVTRHRSIVR